MQDTTQFRLAHVVDKHLSRRIRINTVGECTFTTTLWDHQQCQCLLACLSAPSSAAGVRSPQALHAWQTLQRNTQALLMSSMCGIGSQACAQPHSLRSQLNIWHSCM